MIMDQLHETVNYLNKHISEKPKYGIVLGTGLGALVDELDIHHTFEYQDIPHFPLATVEFHSGKLMFGHLNGEPVVTMQGRFHYYEGYSLQEVTYPIRVMKMLGIEHLFISNACGGLNPGFEEGDLMIIEDHIDLLPANPLTGPNLEELGPRWVDMYDAYNPESVKAAKHIAENKGILVKSGIYAAVQGPNLETPAEYRYLRTIGADAVGMSTVPEVIVARHMSLPVFAISVITDMCTPETLKPADIDSIIAAANKAQPGMTQIIGEMVKAVE